MLRKIIQIDEEKCDGCGLCASACAEGAIRIVDGKAKLVSETYCDGLGACIGDCPQGALTIVERDAYEFDEEAVRVHLDGLEEEGGPLHEQNDAEGAILPCGCPGSMARDLRVGEAEHDDEASVVRSRLGNWPVQLKLVPVNAPFLERAHLLLTADCVPFALGDFHRRFLGGKVLLVGCPKLDDAEFYRDKLERILREDNVASLTVVHMEVPCCSGLVNLARAALAGSGKALPLSVVKVGIEGDILETAEVPAGLPV